jgi:hypothetical protein
MGLLLKKGQIVFGKKLRSKGGQFNNKIPRLLDETWKYFLETEM